MDKRKDCNIYKLYKDATQLSVRRNQILVVETLMKLQYLQSSQRKLISEERRTKPVQYTGLQTPYNARGNL